MRSRRRSRRGPHSWRRSLARRGSASHGSRASWSDAGDRGCWWVAASRTARGSRTGRSARSSPSSATFEPRSDGREEADLVAVRVGAALGSTETTATPEEIAWGFRRLFEAIAAEAPLVVVFDDIHWAEPVLLDLIEYVTTFAQAVPLFLLCTARADLFDLRPTWATPRSNVTLVTLDQFSSSDSETLALLLGRAGPTREPASSRLPRVIPSSSSSSSRCRQRAMAMASRSPPRCRPCSRAAHRPARRGGARRRGAGLDRGTDVPPGCRGDAPP